MATLTELIRQEDPKRPYTDEQLAQMLQLRREQVVELRRINGIPNSWMRLRPALVVEMQKLLEQEPGLSDRSLTLRLNAMGYNVSRYLVKELHSNLPEKEAEPQPEPAVEITTQEETEDTNVFAGMIGYDGGLKAQIHQAKAAVSYPPNGLHTDGIMVNQQGSPFYAEDATAMQRSHKRIASTFPISKVYQAHIPTFAAGYWLFGFASKKYHPINDMDADAWNALNMRTRYYTSRLHVGAFYLPAFLEEMLREVEDC